MSAKTNAIIKRRSESSRAFKKRVKFAARLFQRLETIKRLAQKSAHTSESKGHLWHHGKKQKPNGRPSKFDFVSGATKRSKCRARSAAL
jgi:hypothetical protein